ncbi:MAG TPA: ATP-binding protein [Steroidobacteraceae bacterium]|jgi:signal transduction histidine kinase/CheY-like chemotaxis protein|nr:ATP-binding protein [Steroidobacteraceae bacterium]
MSIDELGIEELRARLAEVESNLQAIYSGEIDALLLADEKGERRVFTLRGADAPYRALVERMQEGAATLSISGDIVYCNQRFADLVCAPLEQVFGASIGRFLPPAESEILRAMLEHGSGRYQTRLMLNGQKATEVQVTLSSIVLEEVEHRTLILSDISSLARAQRENRSKDEFLAMLAHELRNPLGAIQGAVHALALLNQTEPMSLRATGIIKRQVVHMARLVDDLLDVGRAVTGKIVLQRVPVNLAEAVKAQVAAIASGNPNNHGHIDLVSEPAWVSGDPVRLEQIVGNLVSNALKFTRGDGVISVFVGRDGDDAVMRVADQGIGIPADMLPKIFDLFVQAHHTIDRSRGGLGIGLTLVRRLAELHGGSVTAASEGDGRGSTFTVRMPTVAAPKTESEAAAAAATGDAPHRSFESRRVLLVDDNHDSREMYRAVLRAHGHEVCEAPDGERALALLEQRTRDRPLDVAFIDIGLPGGMDGYELARRIRNHPQGRDVRLVALTGYGFPEDRHQSKQAGFARHLVKPVEPEALQRELNAVTRPS